MIKMNLSRDVKLCFAVIVYTGVLSACSEGQPPVKGFVLPEGNIENGQEVFASVGCRSCHTVAALDLPPLEQAPLFDIELGGKVRRVKTYGELLTSIVNPNHTVSPKYRITLDPKERKDAQSPMPVFNDVITVTQLIDLAAFLHSHYEMYSPEYQGYMYVP